MEVSLKQFTRDVTAGGLLAADDLAAFQKELPAAERPADATSLAKKLIQAGKLTRYQAANALQGKAKNLVFGEYVVLDKIGAGGMGQVFKAEHRRMKRIVALKILPPAAVKSPAAVQRFQREVQAAARLEHPNIVPAFDAGEGNGVHFLVMQYVEGQDLASLVKNGGPLPIASAVDYVTQAARGLAYAHAKGIIHRDIKPANLLVDHEGTVKILDMGLARFDDDGAAAMSPAQEGLTMDGQVMGTVDYMAPEQAEDTHQADHRADIYSLGCTLYWLLIGKNLFRGETIVKILLAHREQPVPSLCAKRTEISEPLDRAFQRMVAKRTTDRFQNMNEVVAALEACQPAQNADDPGPSANGLPPPVPTPAIPLPMAVPIAVAVSPTLNQAADAGWQTFDSEHAALLTLTGSAAVKKTWSLTAKIVGTAFGTIIAPLMVALIGNYLQRPNVPPNPPKQTAPLTPVGVIPQPAVAVTQPAVPMPQPVAPTSVPNAVTATAPEKTAPSKPVLFIGKPFDLLAFLDPARDTMDGTWQKRDGALHLDAPPKKVWVRLQLPVETPDEYDVLLTVSHPIPTTPANGLVLIFPMEGQQATVGRFYLIHGWGIERVDGKKPNVSNGTLVPGKQELTAATNRVVIKVRRGGVALACNDEPILDWRGRAEQLSLVNNYTLPDKWSLGLGWHAEFTIHQMTLIPGGSDWTPLFNGRDLTGWNATETGRWTADADTGVLIGTSGTGKRRSSWLLTDREFGDFRLRLEFQLASGTDSGLGLRSESASKDAEQLEIQLIDDLHATDSLPIGAMRSRRLGKSREFPPTTAPEIKPPGSWNEMEVELRGASVRLWINGRQIQDADLAADASDPSKPSDSDAAKGAPSVKRTNGHIGLQTLSSQVRFRNIVIHELQP